MGKKTLIGIGIALFCFGCVGVFNAISDLGETVNTEHDLTTRGKIAGITSQAPPAAMGGDTQRTVKYAFRTEDGKIYFGQESIDEARFETLRQGDRVTVHYQSENPRVSTMGIAPDDLPQGTDPMYRLKICFGVTLFGLLVIIAAFFCKDDNKDSASQNATNRKFSDDPAAALQQWRAEWAQQQSLEF